MANDIFPGAKLMQVAQWGFPNRTERESVPDSLAFSVIHITGNSRLPTGENECAWRQSLDPNSGNSATFFVNRDGSVVQALGDPLHMAPWANGDVNQPDQSNRRIAAVVKDGVNANTRTLVAIENVGYEPGSPITDAQVQSCAEIIAHYHKNAGVAVNRTSVVGHYQLNSVTRPNCPGRDKSVIDRIVELAAAKGAVQEEDPQVIAELQDEIKLLKHRIAYVREQRDFLQTQLDAAAADLATLEALSVTNAEQKQTIIRLRQRVTDIKAKVAALAGDVADD